MNISKVNIEKKTIGFIVEGRSDVKFLEHLSQKLFKNQFDAQIIPMSGIAALVSSSKIVISSLLANEAHHIFILYDIDGLNNGYLTYFKNGLEKDGLLERVSLIPVSQNLEKWIAVNYSNDGFDTINFEELRILNKDFNSLISQIEAKIA